MNRNRQRNALVRRLIKQIRIFRITSAQAGDIIRNATKQKREMREKHASDVAFLAEVLSKCKPCPRAVLKIVRKFPECEVCEGTCPPMDILCWQKLLMREGEQG